MTTQLPSYKSSRASTTSPAFDACTGVPVGARKSSPRCTLASLPLKVRLVPKVSEISDGTGATKLPDHTGTVMTWEKAVFLISFSASMRLSVSGSGVTYFWGTVSREVLYFAALTVTAAPGAAPGHRASPHPPRGHS